MRPSHVCGTLICPINVYLAYGVVGYLHWCRGRVLIVTIDCELQVSLMFAIIRFTIVNLPIFGTGLTSAIIRFA